MQIKGDSVWLMTQTWFHSDAVVNPMPVLLATRFQADLVT